ncbi:MAG TPA: 2-oxoacid:acceptor oxidoreductase subunit alpha, partial [Stellaceae bacterium]|nr:2-oxoacid:acceptor oxidoreductase subunit alpha [Stellaceae bacterium]
LVPAPILHEAKQKTPLGVIYFGSTSPAMDEAAELLAADGVHLDRLRLRGFPFSREVTDFIAEHERIFLVEQNRDAQLRTLLISEGDIDPARLVPILHYDGTPLTARFIVKAIADMLSVVTLAPLKKALP